LNGASCALRSGLAPQELRMTIISAPSRIDGTGAFAQVAFRARQKLGTRGRSRSGIRQQGTEWRLR
jgi:hypothetical protein